MTFPNITPEEYSQIITKDVSSLELMTNCGYQENIISKFLFLGGRFNLKNIHLFYKNLNVYWSDFIKLIRKYYERIPAEFVTYFMKAQENGIYANTRIGIQKSCDFHPSEIDISADHYIENVSIYKPFFKQLLENNPCLEDCSGEVELANILQEDRTEEIHSHLKAGIVDPHELAELSPSKFYNFHPWIPYGKIRAQYFTTKQIKELIEFAKVPDNKTHNYADWRFIYNFLISIYKNSKKVFLESEIKDFLLNLIETEKENFIEIGKAVANNSSYYSQRTQVFCFAAIVYIVAMVYNEKDTKLKLLSRKLLKYASSGPYYKSEENLINLIETWSKPSGFLIL